jgi:hypothetical protein
MSLNLNFNFGRLLGVAEKLTTARFNAAVRGISATITGLVGTSDLDNGAVVPAKAAPGDYFFASSCVLIGTTYNTSGYPVAPAALVDGMILSFKADQINVGSVNLAVDALGAHGITKYGGLPLVAGDIQAQQVVLVQYNTTLLAGPTWEMVSLPGNQILPTQQPIVGSARNLVVQSGVAPTVQVAVTADEILLKNASGLGYLASAVNVTGNITVVGANGIDTGAVAATTWYYVWVIYNPTSNTVAALFSLSATAPTLPAGYTFKALAGTVHAGIPGGSTTDLMNFYQSGNEVWIDEAAVFTAKTGVTAWTAVSGADLTALQALVPPIAKEAGGNLGVSANTNGLIAVAGDANGLGACIAGGTPINTTVLSFNGGGTWRAPLKTAQTIYYNMSNTTATIYRITVRGYRI